MLLQKHQPRKKNIRSLCQRLLKDKLGCHFLTENKLLPKLFV